MTFINALPGAFAQGLCWGIMALGVFLSYKILDFADLTVDGSLCTGAAVFAVLLNAGAGLAVAMLCALLAGMLCGLITGALHAFAGIPPILAGILTQLALWSINLKIMGSSTVPVSVRQHTLLVSGLYMWQSIGILVAFTVVVIGLLYWFFGTQYGCAIRATGCNEDMARAQGVNTGVAKVVGLVISNGLVALSGALLSQYQGAAEINMGRGAIIIGLAAVIIGGAVFSKIGKNFAVQMLAAVVGAIIYFVVYQLVISFGLDADFLKLLSAVVVAIFLSVPYLKQKFSSARHKKGGKHA